MDVRFINPFLSAVLEVLATKAKLRVEPSKPLIKHDRKALGDVTGVIMLSGETNGSLAASFGLGLLKHAMENIQGRQHSQSDRRAKKLAGEITGLVAGVARKYFSKQGLNLVASVPMLVTGKGSHLPHGLHGPILMIPFHGERGELYVEATFRDEGYQRAIASERESKQGVRCISQGDMNQAARHFSKALELNQGNLRAVLGLSRVFLASGDRKKAMEAVRELSKTAAVLEPYYKHVFNASGIMMRELGMYDEAISMYRRALNVIKDDENLWFNLARAYFYDGKTNLARRAINKCLHINPNMKEAHVVHKMILS